MAEQGQKKHRRAKKLAKKRYVMEVRTINGTDEVPLQDVSPEELEKLRAAGMVIKEVSPHVRTRFQKVTKEKRDDLIWLLQQGNSYLFSCETVDISPAYMAVYRDAHPKFDDQVRAAMKTQVSAVADALYQTALGGNVDAQKFFLVNRTRARPVEDPDKWMYQTSIEVSGPGGRPIEHVELTKEERDARLEELYVRYAKRKSGTDGLPKLEDLLKRQNPQQINDKPPEQSTPASQESTEDKAGTE